MKSHHRLDEIFEASLEAMHEDNQALDAILEQHPQQADQLQPMLEAARWLLNANEALEPRAGFINSSRSHIESRIILRPHGFWQRLIGRRTPQRWALNFSAPIVLIILLVLMVNSIGLAARLSIPGDPLYPTKLILEEAHLALTFSQIEKNRLKIQSSRERVSEFVELVLEGKYELLTPAAARMEAEMITTIHTIQDISPENRSMEQPMTAELVKTLSNEIYLLSTLKSTSPLSAYAGIDRAILDAQSVIMALR